MSNDGGSRTFKMDKRPQRYFWAPGAYVHQCRDCGCNFCGDKRALMCADCAYAKPDPENPDYVNEDQIALDAAKEHDRLCSALRQALVERDALRDTGNALQEFLVSSPDSIRDIPDEIYVPWTKALKGGGE